MNLSFEDELTFVPKLNSLSLKLAESNRTSILDRSPKEKDQTLDSSYTFKPTVSGHSSKIVAKLKTGFWDRQKLHVRRQKEKIEQGPSTIHPNHKRPPSKKDLNEVEPNTSSPKLNNSLSDDTCRANAKLAKKPSPYSKSCDGLTKLREKKHELQSELDGFRKKCNASKSPVVVMATTITTKDDTTRMVTPPPSKLHRNSVVIVSPRKVKNISPTLKRNSHLGSNKSNISDGGDHKKSEDRLRARSLTYPAAGKSKTDRMDQEHRKLLRAKKIASEALKGKKIFVCNGPYTTLRMALRKRGWIEKYFKSVPACCVEESDGTTDTQEESDSKTKKEPVTESESNSDEARDAEEITEVFSSDSQYGIMSRIVRNFAPSLIWTLRRDDINFRLLQKDQIVNHYVSAWTFTTKTGLCTNLRNISAFDAKDWRTFFPRCYRLCCEDEKAQFIDDYRLTAVQSILRMVVDKHEEWKVMEEEKEQLKEDMQNKCYEDCLRSNGASPMPKRSSARSSPRTLRKNVLIVLPSSAMNLILKKSYKYLDECNNRDLDIIDDYSDRCLDELHWTTILNYYNQLASSTAIIAKAWSYVEECHEVLEDMRRFCPQANIDGCCNMWILKPGAKSRGRGIEIKSNFNEILSIVSGNISQKENKWVVQKYIERPFLVYRTKFDIRQWFLVTDWNPLMIWFYQDCYIRFCSQEFTLARYDPQVHLSNNSIQKNFQNGIRSEKLPESNMWTSEEFKQHLTMIGKGSTWDELIYPGMKSAIIAALQCCQTSLEYRKNSFELYGADFMLSEDLSPWLIEINSSPALGASTPVTEVMCRNVIEDTLKVVLDRKDNKQADTGKFELAFRQPYIALPSYMGCNLLVEGTPIKQNKPKFVRNTTEPKKSPSKEGTSDEIDQMALKGQQTAKEVKPVPKLSYEKKETKPLDRSKLDGIIEKLSRGAAKLEGNRRASFDNSNGNIVRIEKRKSQTKKIVKQTSRIQHETRICESKSIEMALHVRKHDENDNIDNKRNNKTTTAKIKSSLDIAALNPKSYAIPANNINNNTMTISVADAVETKRPVAAAIQNITTCVKLKRHNKVLKSDSFEPATMECCACCCKSSESLDDVVCPQVASYDLRAVKTYHQAHRLKQVKGKAKQKQQQQQQGVMTTCLNQQNGSVDVDDANGLRETVEKRYQELFISNKLSAENNKKISRLPLRRNYME